MWTPDSIGGRILLIITVEPLNVDSRQYWGENPFNHYSGTPECGLQTVLGGESFQSLQLTPK